MTAIDATAVLAPATLPRRDVREVLGDETVARLEHLYADATAVWERFDRDVMGHEWHAFRPADCAEVVIALLPFRGRARSFLEWGSAHGVIAIAADIIGFDACGIEIDARLVGEARSLAERHGSRARFAAGSLLPAGYEYRSETGDPRLGTLEHGPEGYAELGRALDSFDLVYGYPWTGEEPVMLDLMRRCGRRGAHFLMNGAGGIRAWRVERSAV